MTGLECVALAIYLESRGEPTAGQLAVGSVIWNRVESREWPNEPCEVIRQENQFHIDFNTPIRDQRAWKKAFWAASRSKAERTTSATYFSQPGRIKKRVILRIGNHEFYICGRGR